MPNVGDVAPDFTLQGANGDTVALSDLRGSKRVLLVFYPKDQTSGCTSQLSAVSEALDAFTAADIVPYGVNDGDAASHKAFIEEYDFTVDLLVDDGLRVARAFNALRPEGNRITRTVVVVGKDGRIIYREAGAPPPGEILEAVKAASDDGV